MLEDALGLTKLKSILSEPRLLLTELTLVRGLLYKKTGFYYYFSLIIYIISLGFYFDSSLSIMYGFY